MEQEGLITTSQFLKILKTRELEVSLRKLRLYASYGLIPHPMVLPLPSGGRTGFYSQDLVNTLHLIKLLQEQGQSLNQIRDFLRRLRQIAQTRKVAETVIHQEVLRSFSQEEESVGIQFSELSLSLKELLLREFLKQEGKVDWSDLDQVQLVAKFKSGQVFTREFTLGTSHMQIRKMNPTDFPQIEEVVSLSLKEDPRLDALPLLGHPSEIFSKLVDFQLENFFVACLGDRVVGYGGLQVEKERLRVGRVTVSGPLVHPHFRGKEVGTCLMKRILDYTKEFKAKFADCYVLPEQTRTIHFLRSRFDFRFVQYSWWIEIPSLNSLPPLSLPKGIQIRNYIPGKDTHLFVELRNQCFTGTGDFFPISEEDVAEWEKRERDFELQGVFLARKNKDAVGFCNLIPEQNRLGELGVLPQYRGRGIGKALLLQALHYAHNIGMDHVQTALLGTSQAEIEFYDKMGFVIQKMWIHYRKILVPNPNVTPA